MDFELKPLTLAQASELPADALVLAWPDHLPDTLPTPLTGPWAQGAEALLAWLQPLLKAANWTRALASSWWRWRVRPWLPTLVLVRVGMVQLPLCERACWPLFRVEAAPGQKVVVFLGLPG